MRRNIFSAIALSWAILLGSCTNTPQFGKSPLDKIVSAMTVEEKVNLLVGNPEGLCQTCAIPRLGIPSVTLVSTGIPVNKELLEQTWSAELYQQVGFDCALETMDKGYDCILIPGFWTGNPTLSGMLLSSFARGVQNAGLGTALNLAPGMENAGMDMLARETEHWAVLLSDTVMPAEWEFGGAVISVISGEGRKMDLSGYDMAIPGFQTLRDQLMKAINDGSVEMATVNASVTRILSMIEKRPDLQEKPEFHDNSLLRNTVESEGMVLLRNNGVLPLAPSVRKIGLYGVCSYETVVSSEEKTVNIEDGLEKLGYKIDPAVAGQYRQYVRANNTYIQPQSLARQAFRYRADAIQDDVAIITIGRKGGPEELVPAELELVKDVCDSFHAKGKKVVVILNTDIALKTEKWMSYPDAILLAGIPGADAGTVVSAILTGRVNPSGKLTSGYGSYPLGFGLGYTAFQYSNAQAVHENGKVTMSVTVTNTGNASGKEIVQVYIEYPKSGRNSARQLGTFSKTDLLKPGESQTLSFVIYDYYLPSQSGEFQAHFSASSQDPRIAVPFVM